MMLNNKLQRYLPNLHSLLIESPRLWRTELNAGITTAALLIPQSMAYAMLAGLPPQVGLYAALTPILAYVLLGSTRTLSVGPVAMDSLLTMATLNGVVATMSAPYIEAAGLLAFIVGLSLILMSILKVGRLVKFLSPAMISGFTSAAALIIALSQLNHILGIPLDRSIGAYHIVIEAINKAHLIHPLTFIVGLGSLLIFKGLPKLNSKYPGGLLGIVTMIILTSTFSFSERGVEIVGEIPQGLPSFTMINLDSLLALLTGGHGAQLLGGALSIALLAFMEAISVGMTVSKQQGYQVKPGQELMALGASNITGALFGAYPIAGGFSRTAVNDRAGARTPLASLITFSVVAVVAWRLTPILYYLPQATLSAMIIGAVYGLIDFKEPHRLLSTDRLQALIWFATFVMTLTAGLQSGILSGVII